MGAVAVAQNAEEQRWALLNAHRAAAMAHLNAMEQRRSDAQAVYAAVLTEAKTALAENPKGVDKGLLRTYREVSADLAKLDQAVRDADAAHLQAIANSNSYAEWQTRTAELEAALKAEYAGQGPQYEILIRRLVQGEILCRQLETQGKQGTAEYERATKSVMHLVQALQKYTEENASVRKAINEAVLKALAYLEPEIRPVAPQAWTQALQKLRERLAGERAA